MSEVHGKLNAAHLDTDTDASYPQADHSPVMVRVGETTYELQGAVILADEASPVIRALRVLTTTPHIRAYLAANDAKALEQAERALGVAPMATCSYCGSVHHLHNQHGARCPFVIRPERW